MREKERHKLRKKNLVLLGIQKKEGQKNNR
jgi:hypothetical protein